MTQIQTTETELELVKAEQQITGWCAGIQGFGLVELVEAMGLSADEWRQLKVFGLSPDLSEIQIDLVDKYFLEQANG